MKVIVRIRMACVKRFSRSEGFVRAMGRRFPGVGAVNCIALSILNWVGLMAARLGMGPVGGDGGFTCATRHL